MNGFSGRLAASSRTKFFAEVSVNQLIAFLLDHAMLDFSGDLSLDMVKDFLRNDDSPAARTLLNKLVN